MLPRTLRRPSRTPADDAEPEAARPEPAGAVAVFDGTGEPAPAAPVDAAARPAPRSPLERLVHRLSGRSSRQVPAEHGTTRRGFMVRVAVAGSALAVNPFNFLLKPGTAYASVCGDGSTCGAGWSVFCCTVNNGRNSCPPGSYLAGWWKADNSSFCGGQARYYLDCNAYCPTSCTCYCPTGTCDNRRTCCNQFRYGQCHQEIACYGPVVCRVISCVPPWLFDPSCTRTSATDNATASHSAPCLSGQEGLSVGLGPAVGSNADGRLELFLLGPDRSIQHLWQTAPNSGWTPFVPFKGNGAGTPAVTRNADGRMEVFAVGGYGTLAHAWQTAPNSDWSPFVDLPGRLFGGSAGCAAARNADGRLEVFAVATDGALVHSWQTAPNSGWSGWASHGGSWTSSPALAANADGRLEVFIIGADGRLMHSWQTSAGASWSGWDSLGGNWDPGTNPAVVLGPSGRLELFLLDKNRRMFHAWQTAPNSPWSGFTSFGSQQWRGSPTAGVNADGRLEVFAEGDDRQIWHQWQGSPNAGNWSGWASLGGQSV